jgi:hypothetical protein
VLPLQIPEQRLIVVLVDPHAGLGTWRSERRARDDCHLEIVQNQDARFDFNSISNAHVACPDTEM